MQPNGSFTLIPHVIKNIIILNALMFLITIIGEAASVPVYDYLALHSTQSDLFQPYQIVTHMFMHGGFLHLFFNMYALMAIGAPLEHRWGEQRFLFFYLFSGLGGAFLQLVTNYIELQKIQTTVPPEYYTAMTNIHMVGASGAIMGVLIAFGMMFPNQILVLLFPPIPMKAKYFVLLMIGIDLYLGIGKASTGVAHFAHLGGALFGFLLIYFWKGKGEKL